MRDSRRNTTPKNTMKTYIFEARYWGTSGTFNKEKVTSNSITNAAAELRDKGAAKVLSLRRVN